MPVPQLPECFNPFNMATIDEILGKQTGGGNNPPKGSMELAEQNSGENAPETTPAPTPAPKKAPTAPVTVQTESQQTEQPLSYEALIERFMPKPKTQEELAKDEKKYKRKQIFNAISEGLTALSNLYFTTQGAPNMYQAKDNSIDRTKVNYDRMMSENKSNALAYLNARMGARKADEAKGNADRAWQRTLQLDDQERQRYADNIAHRDAREKVADDRYAAEQAYRQKRDEASDAWREKTFEENKRQADRSYNFQVKQHNDNVEVRREANAATAARRVRGKQLGFSDGEGNQVSIYENVWKGSMQQVYDAMLSDFAPTDEVERKRWERQMKKYDTPQKKEDYVKQNWHKSPKASQLMLALSKIDPATMTSELNDEVVEYDPNDEVIDYVPGK